MPTIVTATSHTLVVVKPAGLPCELPRDPSADSVVRRLASAGYHDLRLVHRLDARTCGLLLLARTPEAAAHYAREIAARAWHKWYVAHVGIDSARASRLIGAHKAYLKTAGRTAQVVRAGGKPSFMDIVVAIEAAGCPADSHLLVRLHTGRFHQIRAMLSALGAPLVGDVRYGGRASGPLYLEHVALAARTPDDLAWQSWVSPPHVDRPRWSPELADAVSQCQHGP